MDKDRARILIEALAKCRVALGAGERVALSIGDPAERDEITQAFVHVSQKLYEGPIRDILSAHPDLDPYMRDDA